jgi:hypothetical protein
MACVCRGVQHCSTIELRTSRNKKKKRNKRRVDNHFGYAESIYDEETCGTRGGGHSGSKLLSRWTSYTFQGGLVNLA